MKSRRTRRFRQPLHALPKDAKRQAYSAYRVFKHNPNHPSLHFKRVSVKHPFYSVRISKNYRAIGLRETDEVIIWVWIGTHAEYDKILAHL